MLIIVNYFNVSGKTYFSAFDIFFSKLNEEANPKVYEMAFQRQNYSVDEMVLNGTVKARKVVSKSFLIFFVVV